ncbi:MAG: ATP-dependent RNA helicase RhlE [Alphaproteobacteria bacterium MarineAlpha3_Bin5]|nr:MAG: ATP-dependent RNA helicase RhlE [Alphaproteobacteria bacterium MarineAlpha3_Bin5]
MNDFSDLNLAPQILRALKEKGYKTPTKIQIKSIPILTRGRDILGIAQTGTGKTAAFVLPVLHRISKNSINPLGGHPCTVILAPTRELAIQIQSNVKSYGCHLNIRSTVVFGGAPIRPQIKALKAGVHVLIATPGRLMDLINKGYVKLKKVEYFILDEADRMLDMGFIDDVRKLSAMVPETRQTIMFSATMPSTVKALANRLLTDAQHIEVEPAVRTAKNIGEKVLFLPKDKKKIMLAKLMENSDLKKVLVFTRTKRGADKVCGHLKKTGIDSEAIHGNKAQNARQRSLNKFRSGTIRVLVATDLASRGIDVDSVSHVINYELPNSPDSYVHRIGRTARHEAHGMAISFCDHHEYQFLRGIEKLIQKNIPVYKDHPFHIDSYPDASHKSKIEHKFQGTGKKRKKVRFRKKTKYNRRKNVMENRQAA